MVATHTPFSMKATTRKIYRYVSFVSMVFFFSPLDVQAKRSVARVVGYLFNLEATDRPKKSIHDGEHLASNATTQTWQLSTDAWNQLNREIDSDQGVLHRGLSKCFIPRHGVVAYDTDGHVVGAISVCFECDAVRRLGDNPPPRSQRLNPALVKSSLGRLERIKSLLKRAGLPIGAGLRHHQLSHQQAQVKGATRPSDDWSRLQTNLVACFNRIPSQAKFKMTLGEVEFRAESTTPLNKSLMTAADRCVAIANTHLEGSPAGAAPFSLKVETPNAQGGYSMTLRRTPVNTELSPMPPAPK